MLRKSEISRLAEIIVDVKRGHLTKRKASDIIKKEFKNVEDALKEFKEELEYGEMR